MEKRIGTIDEFIAENARFFEGIQVDGFTNVGRDEDGQLIGNCKKCGVNGVLVSDHKKECKSANEGKQNISDMDGTSEEYAKYMKSLKVGDKFLVSPNGEEMYSIGIDDYEKRITKLVANIENFGATYGQGKDYECEVIDKKINVFIDSFDDKMKCIIAKIPEFKNVYYAFPMEM